jgi:predicted PurR-regulated permease PerM
VIKENFVIPPYARITLILLGIFTLISILYITQDIVVPFVFAAIIAIVLHPVVNFLVKQKVNRVVAIIISLVLTFILIASFAFLILSQINRFTDSWPSLVGKFNSLINETIGWASQYFDIHPIKITDWIAKEKSELIDNNMDTVGRTLSSMGTGIVAILVIPVYIFLLMFYKPLILEFIRRLFGVANKTRVNQIITQVKTVIQSYLVGLIIETIIIAVLNTTVLLILGIQYAVLLGVIGAMLNLIPYIGGVVGVALPMIVALATKDSAWYAMYVLGLYYVIQLIDNNYIVPVIVSSKVKINALFSIIVVFAGNALWGVSGMFLSIPLLAIIKLIFDHIESLKPWGFLLGDTMPASSLVRINPGIKKLIKKSK